MSDHINSTNSSLYFASAANAAQEAAREANKKKRVAQASSKKISFADALRKNREQEEFVAAGFPAEIASMSAEDAAIFLKDRMDEAGDRLSEDFTADAFSSYRLAVNQFVKYIVKNNFAIDKHNRHGINKRTGKRRDPLLEIQVINQKLDRLATDMLATHLDKLQLLARVNEIQGLIVDLMAA